MKRSLLVLGTFLLLTLSFSSVLGQGQLPTDVPDLVLQYDTVPLENVEDENIVISFSITNNDDITYRTVVIVLFKGQSEGRPGSQVVFTELTRTTLNELTGGETISDDMEFREDAGSYVIQLVVLFENVQLLNTAILEDLEIFSAPVGETDSLLLAFGIIYGALFIFIVLRPIIRK
jgi:hypothetical protein